MDLINQILENPKILDCAQERTVDDEYIKDGIRYCKHCNTPKGVKIEILSKVRIVPTSCKCRAEALAKDREQESNREKQNRLDRIRKYSMMDSEFFECTFENWNWKLANSKFDKAMYDYGIEYVKKWHEMKEQNQGLLIWGLQGVGKSYLSFCIANALLQMCVPVIAISSIGIIDKVRASGKQRGEDGQFEMIGLFKNADLLVIDDLGAEYKHEWHTSIIYSIIDSRSRMQKPTIITTNKTMSQLKDHLTGSDGVNRIYDRFNKICVFLEYKGQSKREMIKQQKQIEFIKLINEKD